MKEFIKIISIGSIFLAGTQLALAEKSTVSGADEIKLSTQSLIRSGFTLDHIKNKLLQAYDRTDIDGNGITQADYDAKKKMDDARNRSYKIRQWLTMDLDADGKVSKKEVEVFNRARATKPIYHQGIQLTPTKEQSDLVLEQLVKKSFKGDINNDDHIDFMEALEAAKKQPRYKKKRYSYKNYYTYRVPLSLDADADGSVSKEEFSKAVDVMLKEIDKDENGELSSSEVREHNTTVYAIRRNTRK